MENLIKRLRTWRDGSDNCEDLSRSQYSLVSSTDLTAGALQLWLGLPDEIKYDPALEQFKQYYEKEHGVVDERLRNISSKRLPSVNSAPHLTSDVNGLAEDAIGLNDVKSQDKVETQKQIFEADVTVRSKKTKISQARHTIKITLLIGVWIFFTIVFLMHDEKSEIFRHSSVAPGETKDYILRTNQHEMSVLLKLTGPFISEQFEKKLHENEKNNMTSMRVWLEKWRLKDHVEQYVGAGDVNIVQASTYWTIIIEDQNQIDFQESEMRSAVLELETFHDNRSMYAVKMSTNANFTTPFTFSYTVDPLDPTAGITYALVLLCALYALIVFEVINRTMAALLLSTTSLAVLSMAGERPTLIELVTWLDVETLLLLFSMMVLVAIMTETGLFDFIAVLTFKLAKGNIWPLITILCLVTIVVSLLLDNVTTVLFMTPVTIRLCEVMDLDPVPVLMSMVLFCNLGGTATPVGDPPNVIIASNKLVIQAGINFTNFTLHMATGIIFVCIQTYCQLRFIYRDINKFRLTEPRDVQDLRHQICIWRRAADSLPHLSRDELVVRERLERKIQKLTARLNILISETKSKGCTEDYFNSTLADMQAKYKIRDKGLLLKCSVTIVFVVIAFFLHSIPQFNHPDIPYMKLKLTTWKDIVTCDQSKEKNYTIIAFEGEPLHIFIEYDSWLNSVKCYDEKANATVFLNTMHIDSKKTIEVLNITSIMGGKWICKISVRPNNKPNKRVKTVVCYIKVHVRLKYAHHILRVNYMPMKPTRESINTRDFDHYVEYKYKNGDKVDIFCYNAYDPLEECTIDMKYYYEELKDHILELKSPKVVQSNIELHLNHSGSFIDCIYTCKKDYQIQRMKFVSSNDFTNDIKLNVNQQETRIHMDNVFKFMGQWNIYLHFQIFQNEYFNIICGEYSKFYECNHFCDYRLPTICKKWAFKDKVTCITHYIHNIDHFEIVLRVQRIYETTDTGFQHLSLNLPNNNTVMNFLSEKERVIYYAFDDSNEIAVSCIRKEMPGQKTYISTTKKLNADRKINRLTDKLKMSHHDVYTCALYKSSRKFHSKILYKITVIFVQKEIDEIMITTNDPGIIDTTEMTVTDSSVINTPGVDYIAICFVVGTIILMVGVATVIYQRYMKTKIVKTQSVYINLDETNSSMPQNQVVQENRVPQQNSLHVIYEEVHDEYVYDYVAHDYNPNAVPKLQLKQENQVRELVYDTPKE